MRIKNRGGRARRSKLPSPSPPTLSLPLDDLNPDEAYGEYSIDRIVPEISSDIASHDSDTEIGISSKNCGCSGMDIDWLERKICIKCQRGGGRLLICSETDCPIDVHEKCMNCGPKFDDMGNFQCPVCWCKHESARVRELRRDVMEVKKALSSFLDSYGVDMEKNGEQDKGKECNMSSLDGGRNCGDCEDRMNNDLVENRFVLVREDQEGGRDNAKVADCCDQSKTVVEPERDPVASLLHDVDNISCRQEKSLGVKSPVGSISKERRDEENVSRVNEFEISEDGENIQVEDSGEVGGSGHRRTVGDLLQAEPSAHCEEEENGPDASFHQSKKGILDDGRLNQDRREEVEQMQPEASGTETCSSDTEATSKRKWQFKPRSKKKAQPHNVNSSNKLSSLSDATAEKISRDRVKKVTAPKKSSQEVSARNFTNLAFPKEKRRRLWTAEEEDMLREGVRKFSSTVNKNLPWRKILEFGRHVFDSCRSPSDLKDKWRNLTAK